MRTHSPSNRPIGARLLLFSPVCLNRRVEGMFKKRETSSLENNPMSGDWLFCKEPPEDPSVTCFLADDVDWLDGRAPEGSPWLCSDSPAMRESPHDGSAAWPKVTTWSLPRSIDHGGLGEPELSGSLHGERSRQRPTC